MIPKIIHYCWFGGNPMPESAVRCMESWKKYCPDYEIKEWNEKNFDVNATAYTREAFEARKWAFITDYVRLYALDRYGGIYMDTDVEVIKPLDPFLELCGFSGFELPDRIPTGLMAAEKGQPLIAEFLALYDEKHFIRNGAADLTTNVEIMTACAKGKGLALNGSLQVLDGFTFFPQEYFCPKNNRTLELAITDNTVTIHHFNGSWTTGKSRAAHMVKRMLGAKAMEKVLTLTDRLHITGR